MPPKKPPVGAKSTPSGDGGAGGSGQPAARPLYAMSILKAGDPFGTLIFELAVDALPRTTENFKQLAAGVTVGDKKNPKTATYKGCRFLRLTDEGLQTGDALHRDDGKGNDSIYGPVFDDEAFGVYPHAPGVLSMCNSGPNTNGSQFFICRASSAEATASLDGHHVSFGKLMEGGLDVLQRLVGELAAFTSDDDATADTATAGCINPSAPFTIGSITLL